MNYTPMAALILKEIDKTIMNHFMNKQKEQQMKMTREDAIKKLMSLDYDTKEGCDYDLRVLEALGLLKFEDEKKEDTSIDGTDYIKYAKEFLHYKPSVTWGSSSHIIIQGLLNIIEGHVKPNVDNWTVSKGDEIKIKFEGWHKNNPQYEGRVVNIEKSPGS